MKLIAGNSNPQLAFDIAEIIDEPLADAEIKSFSDCETKIDIHETVRGADIFVIQSTSQPANQHLMELLILLDTLKRSSVKRITAVMPYFGYARQDSKPAPRTPITAKLIANLLTAAGADRILTVDLHARQIQGFFDIPVDNLYAVPLMVRDIKKRFNGEELVMVSPDVGGVVRARAVAKKIDTDLAIIDKRRDRDNESEVMNVIGDINNRHCIIIDDMVDTAGTLCNAADALMAKGAASVHAYATHGVLSGPANHRLNISESLTTLTITDTIQYPYGDDVASDKVRKIPISKLLSQAIKRISEERSVSALFN